MSFTYICCRLSFYFLLCFFAAYIIYNKSDTLHFTSMTLDLCVCVSYAIGDTSTNDHNNNKNTLPFMFAMFSIRCFAIKNEKEANKIREDIRTTTASEKGSRIGANCWWKVR